MTTLSEHDVFLFVAQLGIIILAARLCGAMAKSIGQPVIVGEVIAGIILGPTILGNIFPDFQTSLFPATGVLSHLIQGVSWLCVLFLLLVTGLEIDVRSSLRHAKRSVLTSLLGLFVPLFIIFFISAYMPKSMYPADANPLYTRLLLTTALSVVAIPVVAKILFDLQILRSFVGLNIITAGVLSDIWGWTLLAVIISVMNSGAVTVMGILKPLLIMAAYLGFTLTVGRGFVDKILDFFKIQAEEPTTVLSLLFSLALLNGAISHLLGLHVLLGAFMAGLMAGESPRITPFMRQSVQDFIFGVFAPIFFVLIGMQLSFGAGVNWTFTFILLFVATITKILGGYLGALWGGIGQKNAFAVGCGLNTQGTMGIIIALIGVDLGVFNSALFSSVVFICIVTSLFVGPLLKWAIKGVERPLAKYFDKEHVFLNVPGNKKPVVISNMAKLMANRGIVPDAERIRYALMSREEEMSTAIGEGVALPHARLQSLEKPILCFFRLENPVEYSSPDNKPVQLLFVELTDNNDDGMQLNLITQISRFISKPANRKKLLKFKKEEEIHQVLSLDDKV